MPVSVPVLVRVVVVGGWYGWCVAAVSDGQTHGMYFLSNMTDRRTRETH